MENFEEIKKSIVEQATAKGACKDQLQRAIDAQTLDELKDVINDNIWWCVGYDITVPDGYYKNNSCEFIVVNGKLNGEYIKYHDNGKVNVKLNYINDGLQGQFISYYDNGQVALKCNYVDGFRHGECVSYYSNGQVNFKCNYIKGLLQDEYVSYWSNGQVDVKCNYVNGEIVT